MLVLDRKAQEGFWIDGRIYVKVLDIGRRRVKLGIDAPGEVSVVREELCAHTESEAEVAS
jgi:carbon storage regulator